MCVVISESPASLVFLFSIPFFASLTVLNHIIGIRLEALEMCYILVHFECERIIRTYLTLTRWFVIFRAHAWLLSSQSTI